MQVQDHPLPGNGALETEHTQQTRVQGIFIQKQERIRLLLPQAMQQELERIQDPII